MRSRDGVGRVAVALVVAVVVISIATAGGLVLGPSPGVEAGPAHPEYDVERLAADRLETGEAASMDATVGDVLVDRSHDNRFDRASIAPLERAVTQAGGTMNFVDSQDNFTGRLADASALVIVDPGSEYSDSEIAAIRSFAGQGGKVVIAGEPNQNVLRRVGIFAIIVGQQSELTELTSAFGITVSTDYVHDQGANDGNYKRIVTSPPEGTDHTAVADVSNVVLGTAASVEVHNGSVLLRTAPTAVRGGQQTDDGYPVAAVTANDSVLAIGDATVLSSDFQGVGDNAAFVGGVVEFLAAGEQPDGELDTG